MNHEILPSHVACPACLAPGGDPCRHLDAGWVHYARKVAADDRYAERVEAQEAETIATFLADEMFCVFLRYYGIRHWELDAAKVVRLHAEYVEEWRDACECCGLGQSDCECVGPRA